MATLAQRAKDGHLRGPTKEKDALGASKLGRNPTGRHKTRLWPFDLLVLGWLRRKSDGRLRRNEADLQANTMGEGWEAGLRPEPDRMPGQDHG